MLFRTIKGKDGENKTILIKPPVHPALLASMNEKHESPDNRARHLKHISSVLIQKSKNVAKNIHERKKAHELAIKQQKESMDAKIDEILDSKEFSPKEKFNRLQRFAVRNHKQLSNHQITLINQSLMNLDLENNLTPDLPEPVPTHAYEKHNDNNDNPVTFAHGLDDVDFMSEEEVGKMSRDDRAINDNAHLFQSSKAKSNLPETTQGEVDLENRKGK